MIYKNPDNGKIYLKNGSFDTSPGGVFDGVVEEIAIVDGYLFAKVDRLFEGDVDGVYKLQLSNGRVSGPVQLTKDLEWQTPTSGSIKKMPR